MMEFFHYVAALSAGIGNTLLLTGSAFAIGAVVGLPMAAARNSSWLILRSAAGTYVEVVRGIPPIAWLFVLFYGVSQFDVELSSTAAAILGLGLIAGAYMTEIYRSGLRAIPHGQFEAARALGLRGMRTYRYVLAPQAIVTVVPPAVAFAIGLLKDSAVASVIGVQEITTLALSETRQEFAGLTIFVAAGAVYLLISVPVAMFGRWLGNRLTREAVTVS
jgi:polar amino acid transport system permease protein